MKNFILFLILIIPFLGISQTETYAYFELKNIISPLSSKKLANIFEEHLTNDLRIDKISTTQDNIDSIILYEDSIFISKKEKTEFIEKKLFELNKINESINYFEDEFKKIKSKIFKSYLTSLIKEFNSDKKYLIIFEQEIQIKYGSKKYLFRNSINISEELLEFLDANFNFKIIASEVKKAKIELKEILLAELPRILK